MSGVDTAYATVVLASAWPEVNSPPLRPIGPRLQDRTVGKIRNAFPRVDLLITGSCGSEAQYAPEAGRNRLVLRHKLTGRHSK